MSLPDFLDMLRGFLPQGVHGPEGLTPEAMEIILAPWSSKEGKRALFRNFRRLNPEYTQAIAGELTQLDHETLILWRARRSHVQHRRAFARLEAQGGRFQSHL